MAQDLSRIDSQFETTISSGQSAADGTPNLGYAANLDKHSIKDIKNNPQFIRELFDYYSKRDGVTFTSVEEAYDHFIGDRRWRNMNSAFMVADAYNSIADDPQQNAMLARLQKVYEATPSFYEEGGDGFKGFAEVAGKALLDPLNLIGFGAGGQAAKGAAMATRQAATGFITKEAGGAVTKAAMQEVKRDATKAALWAGTKAGAVAEAKAGALTEGLMDAAGQVRDVNLGLQEGYSAFRTAEALAGGAVFGGGLGGVFGAAGAGYRAAKGDITAGIKEGQQAIRAERAQQAETQRQLDAETNAADQANVDPNTPDELSARVLDRATRLRDSQEASMDGAAESRNQQAANASGQTTNLDQQAMQTGEWPNNINASVEAAKPTEADLLQTADGLRRDLSLRAAQLENQANSMMTPDGKPASIDKVTELRTQAMRAQNAARQLKRSLERALEDGATPEEIARIEADVAELSALMPPDPNAPPAVRGQLPDGSPMIGEPTRVADQPAGQTAGEAAVDAVDEAEVLAQEQGIETDVADVEARINNVDSNIQKTTAELEAANQAGDTAKAAALQEQIAGFNTNREQLNTEKQTLESSLEKLRAARTERQTRANTQTANQTVNNADVQATAAAAADGAPASGTPVVKQADAAQNQSAPNLSQVFAEYTPEALVEAAGVETNSILDVLEGLGHNRKYEARVLKQLGDARTKAGREKRQAYLLDQVKRAYGRETVRSSVKFLGANKFDFEMGDAYLEVMLGNDPVALAHARDIHGKFLDNAAYKIFMAENAAYEGSMSVSEITDLIRSKYGEDMGNRVANLPKADGMQFAGIPESFDRDALVGHYKLLNADQKARIQKFRQIFISNLKRDAAAKGETISEKQVSKMADDATSGLVEQFLQSSIAKKPVTAEGVLTDNDFVDRVVNKVAAPHMGTQRRQGMGKYTVFGKVVKGGDVIDRAQGILKKANRFGYHGQLIAQIAKRDSNGDVQKLGGVASALEQLYRSTIDSANNRMVVDPIRRQRSVESAIANKQDKFNPDVLEPIIEDLNKSGAAIRAIEKKIAAGADGEALAKLEKRLTKEKAKQAEALAKANALVDDGELSMAAGTNAVGVSAEQVAPGSAARPGAEISVTDTTGQAAKFAREERQKTVAAAQRVQTGNEINAVRENPDALLEVLRERNRSLTRSTGKEAAGNRVEQARATEAQTVLMSQLADVRKRIARHEAQIKRGEKADLSEAEVVAMNAQLANLAKAIEAGVSDLGVAGRKVFQEMKVTARRERMAEREIQRRVHGDQNIDNWSMTDEELDAIFGTPTSEDFIAVDAQVNETMRRAGVEKKLESDVSNLKIEQDLNKLTRAQLIERIITMQSKAEQRMVDNVAPQVIPASLKHKPVVRVIDGIEVDLNNDFNYVRAADDSVDVSFNGKRIGQIKEVKGYGWSFTDLTGKQRADSGVILYKTKRQLQESIPVFARDEIHAAAKDGRLDVRDGEQGLSYTEENWQNTETYGGEGTKATRPATQAPDPVESPKVIGDPNNPLSMTADNFEVPAGRQLAIQIIDPASGKAFKSVRVFSYTNKQTVGGVLKNSAKYQYVIGSVEMPYRSGTIGAETSFRPLNPDDSFYLPSGDAPVRGADVDSLPASATTSPRARGNRPAKMEDVAGKPLVGADPAFANEGVRTVGDLIAYINNLDNIPWAQLSGDQYSQFMQSRVQSSLLLQRNLPNGVEQPTTTVRRAVEQVRNIFAGKADDEIQGAEDLLMRVAYNNGGVAPLVTDGPLTGFVPNSPDQPAGARNSIVMGENSFKLNENGQRETPATLNLIHEIGHWMYANLMNEAERLQFWDAMGKYINSEGFVDFDSLSNRSTGVYTNELESPAEFFANQFSIWVMSNKQVNNMSLWESISRRAIALIKKFVKGEDFEVDPDLVPIFQKYMPTLEVDPVTGASNGGISKFAALEEVGRTNAKPGKENAAAMAGRQIRVLDERKHRLMDAFSTSYTDATNSGLIVEVLEDVARKLYGEYGGKSGAETHRYRADKPGMTGTNRLRLLDNKHSLSAIMKTVKEIHQFMYELRGTNMYKDGRLSLDMSDVAPDADSKINNLIAEQGGRLDASEVDGVIQTSVMEGLDWKITGHLRKLGNDLSNAMDMAMDDYRSMFLRNLEKDGREGYLSLDMKTGTFYRAQPSMKSLKARRINRQEAIKEIDEIITLNSMVEAIEKAGLAPYIDEASVADVKITKAPARMSKDELAREASKTPADTKRAVDIANELQNRLNTQAKQTQDTMTETEQLMVEQIVDRESANRIANLALKNGNPRVAKAAFAWLRNHGIENPVPITNPKAAKAINSLTEANDGVDAGNGIPQGAPSSIKDHIGAMSHRDKRTENVQHTVFSRVLAMLGKLDESDVFTEYDAKTILGQAADDADDVIPLPTNSAAFSEVRDRIRKVARLAMSGKEAEAIQEVAEIQFGMLTKSEKEAFESIAELQNLPAEDAPTIAAEAVQQMMSGIPESQLPLNNTARRLVRGMSEQVAVILNGQIQGGVTKPQLIAHGDVFASVRAKTPLVAASNAVSASGVHPSMAVNFAREVVNNLPKRLTVGVREFLGLRPSDSLDGHVFFNVSDRQVNGITASDAGDFGPGLYLRKGDSVDAGYNAQAAKSDMMRAVDEANLSPEDHGVAADAVDSIIGLRERIKRESSSGKRHTPALSDMLRSEARYQRILTRLVPTHIDNKVFPVFARVSKAFQATSKEVYSIVGNSENNISNIMMEMATRGMFNETGARNLRSILPGNFTGVELYRALTDDANGIMHKHGSSFDGAEAKEKLNAFLKEKGFDAIETDDGFLMFNEKSVRELEGGFNESDLIGSLSQDNNVLRATAQIAEAMGISGRPFDGGLFPAVTTDLQRAGVPDGLIKPLRRMVKGRELGPSDVERISKFSSALNFLKENSAFYRSIGANWFADKLKPLTGGGFFEKHNIELNNTLFPLLMGRNKDDVALNTLDDAKSSLGRWWSRNAGLAFQDIKQPESHARIIGALRRGREAVAKLNPKEKAVALKIARAFEKELGKLRELGIPVGDTRKNGSDFYIPQIWDADAIRANPNKFMAGLVNYLKREQNQPDFIGTRLNQGELEAKAQNIFERMAGDDGVMDMMIGEGAISPNSDPFHARVFKLKSGDFDELDGFLMSNLEGIIAKYFDRTTRKRLLTEQFGVQGHAYKTYQTIVQFGKDGAVRELLGDHTLRDRVKTALGDGDVEQTAVPRLPHGEEMAKQVVEKALAALGTDPARKGANKFKAMQIILNAQEQSARTNPQFVMRVEAVVNGLADFPNGGMSSSSLKKMDQMVNVLNRRPIDGTSGNEIHHKVVRRLKSFNSVTLLGFTTLTSLPDVVTPLLRGGHARAWSKAWSKWMLDDDYKLMAKRVGTGIENMLHDRMVQMAGEGGQKFTNAFFNATLLTPWTNTVREVAAMVGMESMKVEIEKAVKLMQSGQKNSRAYQRAEKFLLHFGLTGPDAPHDFIRSQAFAIDRLPEDPIIENQVRTALLKFTNESVFAPNPNDIPQWAQHPGASLVWQLKSYPLMFQRLVGGIIDEAKNGNTKPLMYFLSLAPMFGVASLAIKDVIQMRGGDDEQSADFRNRKVSNMAGFGRIAKALGVEDESMADKAIGWYLEGMITLGGFGLLADVLYNSAAQLDNGAYGTIRIASVFAGPTAGTFASGVQVAAGASHALFGEDDSNYRERAAIRETVRRIPVVGGIASVREGAADLAGESSRKSGGGGGYGSSSY